MTSLDITQSIPVRSFSFNLPCREFVIAAQVTRDKRLPVVDEFMLRVLHQCESISSSRLTRFFGFTEREVEIVLADLQARSLITIENNEVSLHPSGKELFRTSGDEPPTITDIESFPARIWFDLISRSMIRSRGLHNVKNLITLTTGASKVEIPENFAREAFQDNFRDYLRNTRKIKDADRWNLYAITDVVPGRFSYAQVAGRQSLILEEQPKLETTLFESESDQPQKLRLLTSSMSQALSILADPEPVLVGRTEYSRLTGTNSLENFLDKDGFFNLQAWLAKEQENKKDEHYSFVGSSYLERNRKAMTSLLGSSDKNLKNNGAWELFWFRPGGSLWGKTEDLGLTLGDVRAMSRRTSSTEGGIVTSLIAPASVSRDLNQFDRIFDRGLIAKAGRGSPSIEIILIRGILATVSVLVPLSNNINIWIGRTTINQSEIQHLEDKLKILDIEPELTPLWSENKIRVKAVN